MGRILERNESLAHGNYPGCITGILHILDYHHWHLKKLVPHRKHRLGFRRNHGPKTVPENHDLGRAEAEPLLAKQHGTKSVPKSKRSRSWILSFSMHSWLQRLNPVHHFEPSENCCDDATIIPNKKSEEASKLEDVYDQKLAEGVDFMDVFTVDKDFFFKILQDPESRTGSRLRGLRNSNIKVRLSKSKSFPVANSSPARSVTLEHKRNEVWFFLGGDKPVVEAELDNDEAKQTALSSSSSDRGWNQVVVSRFGDIKRKMIKHSIKEGQSEEIVPSPIEDTANSIEEDVDDDLEKRRGLQRRVRRSASLNESLERYSRLFDDTALSRDTKLSHSRSLKVLGTTSDEKVTPPRARKHCRRNLSLSDFDSLASIFDLASIDALRLGMSFKAMDFNSTVDTNETPAELSNESSDCLEEAVSLPNREPEIESCHSEGVEFDHRRHETQKDMNKKEEEKKTSHVAESEDFLYVKQMIEMSAFFGEDEEVTWHSLDQPLSPSLFRQLESYEEDEDHHQQLLFDLVNETLGDMNERSYTYFPRGRAMAKGERLVEEVWKRTSSRLRVRPELDKSLDDVVARDLAERDGRWMSLEWEREMVALELEDLIFHDLLDQLLCSLV